MRFISYNLKNAQSDFDDWILRREKVTNFIKTSKPDIFAVQEADEPWVDYFSEQLTDYSYIGKGREDGESKGESTGIYYISDKFELLNSGVFWLSDTPQVPSKSWGAMHNRTVTYVVLKNVVTKHEFVVYNTHLDHVSQEARIKGAKLIIEHAQNHTSPVIIMGDFNLLERSNVYQELESEGYRDTKWLADKVSAFSTLNWFIAEFDTGFVIDFIFVQGIDLEVKQYHIETSYLYNNGEENRPISDHYPVTVDLRLTR